MHKKVSGGRRAGSGVMLLATLALIVPLFSGCSAPREMAQAQQVEGSPTALISTPSPASSTTAIPSAGTPSIQATGTVTGTTQVVPTPSGVPSSAFNTLNAFRYVPTGKTLVKQDRVQLDAPGDGAGEAEVLLTIMGPSETITGEVDSGIGVLSYDSVARQWGFTWSSEVVSGTASPLLNIGQKEIGGFNGGDILRTGDPILVVRTTLDDGRAQLHLWRWNRGLHNAAPVKKSGGAPVGNDVTFEADLDINLMDIDDDGIYEIVADNLSGVQIWKWDGNTFAVEGGQ